MIHTRMGSEVAVLQKPDPGQFVRVRRVPDGAVRDIHISDLREDTAGEIAAAIAAAGPAPQGGFDGFR